jgi:hypothetical protein
MVWTIEEMKALGVAYENIATMESLIGELESLGESLYENIIGDDGETIERCHRLIRQMQTYVVELEAQKLEDFNKEVVKN